MEKTLSSGSAFVASLAPFDDASELNDALLLCAKGLPFQREWLQMDLTVLKDAMIGAATDPRVKAALFKCWQRCVRDGRKVDRDLFDDPKLAVAAREDYYEMAVEVAKLNCAPFINRIFSLLKAALATAPADSPR